LEVKAQEEQVLAMNTGPLVNMEAEEFLDYFIVLNSV